MQPETTRVHTTTRLLVKFVFVLILTGSALAQASHSVDIRLDPAATKVHWTLGDVLHTVNGTFKLKEGVIQYDPFSGDASGLIAIDATSGDSGSAARDQRMHNNVLESARFQTITFRPTHVEGKFDRLTQGDFVVDGVFSLHGQDHPMKMKVIARPQSNGIGLTTHFEVPYVQWGLKDPSTFVLRVDKQVSIDVESVAQVKP